MKRVLLLCFVILFAWAGVASAQEEPAEQELEGITRTLTCPVLQL